jgi:hypothetical protein
MPVGSQLISLVTWKHFSHHEQFEPTEVLPGPLSRSAALHHVGQL